MAGGGNIATHRTQIKKGNTLEIKFRYALIGMNVLASSVSNSLHALIGQFMHWLRWQFCSPLLSCRARVRILARALGLMAVVPGT